MSVTFVGSWITFIFEILLWFVMVIFLKKNGRLIANNKMSFLVGLFYSLGSGTLFGLLAAKIFLSNFEIG